MNSTTEVEDMVEVRLRYRPVGDVLTVTVRSSGPPGPTFQTEIDDDTFIEWMRMPDGSQQLTAMQLSGARSRCTDDGTASELPEALRGQALDLMNPGHRHYDHPSTRRPTTPTATHDVAIQTTTDALTLRLIQPHK